MSGVGVAPGGIFHWEKYEFADGEKANKYIVSKRDLPAAAVAA